MNLKDLVDDDGLQQNEWSLTRPKFGEDRQLEVIGWSKKLRDNKYYILMCSVCAQDSELFGEGYFKVLKSSLVRGNSPCGCSKKHSWSSEQYAIICSRKAESLGYKFLRFEGVWKGNNTKITMFCKKHGEWSTGSIKHLVRLGTGCPECRNESYGDTNRKDDNVMVEAFLSSGGFHPDTKFWRSDRISSIGTKIYWFLLCPECGEIGESQGGSLNLGKCPCACSMQRQREGYINLITGTTGEIIAIKFGISRDSNQRREQQNSKSMYEIIKHSIYIFPSVQQCKQAERECKKELETGVLSKIEVPDGHTETTWVYNLEKIIEIYGRNGGISIESAT